MKIQNELSKASENGALIHGDNAKGSGYFTRDKDAEQCYTTMTDVIRMEHRNSAVRLLDVGCGLAHMYRFVREHRPYIQYTGVDISENYLEAAKKGQPDANLSLRDILENPFEDESFDYVVMNSIFNFKGDRSKTDMESYFVDMLRAAYRMSRYGISFNNMSTIVDWERDDLFHVSFDWLAQTLHREFGRHFRFIHDYGMYEFATHVYKTPYRIDTLL